jgi:hypothetical protein
VAARKTRFPITLSMVIIFVHLLPSCSSKATLESTLPIIPYETPVPTNRQIKKPEPADTIQPGATSTPSSTQVYILSSTPSPTINSTYQAWHAKAISISETERAARQLAWNDKATQIAQFPITCESWSNPSDISPDGKWSATDCGPNSNRTLIVQNKEGIKWVLYFKDFLSPDTPEWMPGGMHQKFWSPEGKYLYITPQLGYSGGGNQCFSYSRGNYGLFRLNLTTGSWTTIVPFIDSFPGNEIEFSPNGRWYGITLNGITITDLKTGDVIQINAPGEMEMRWSPDSKHLAYSLATCGEEFVQTSSVYVWDTSTKQTRHLLTTEAIVLRPESWINNSTLRINGEKWVGLNNLYTIYEYDIEQNSIIFTGTATPFP